MTFTPEVYEEIRAGAKRSARLIGPLVYDLFEPKTVVDVGCGEGFFARQFAEMGCKVVGVDESIAERRFERVTENGELHLLPADLTGDAWAYEVADGVEVGVGGDVVARVLRGFDLAVCLEVAEHLSPGAADAFVGTLCALAPVVLFSAAIPGQGGHGHLNEQWPAYWVERFERHGFQVSGELRWHIWGSAAEPWYQQNLLVAVHRERARLALSEVAYNRGLEVVFGEHAFSEPIPVVHPTTFSYWVEIAKARR